MTNLERHWERVQALVGPARARIWRLYMAASALNFEAGRTNLHQVLGVKPGSGGSSGMPLTRTAWRVQRFVPGHVGDQEGGGRGSPSDQGEWPSTALR